MASIELLKKLTEEVKEAGTVLKGLQELSDGKAGEMPADHQEKWENAEKAYDSACDRLAKAQKAYEVEQNLQKADDFLHVSPVAKTLGVSGAASAEITKSAVGKLIMGAELNDLERKSLTVGNDPRGGYLAPTQLLNDVIQLVINRNWIRGMSRNYRVNGASGIDIPVIATNSTLPAPTSEIATSATDESAMALGLRTLRPRLRSLQQNIGRIMDVASPIDVYNIMVEQFAYAKAEKEEREFLTGNGADEAMGTFTVSDNGVSSSRNQLLATSTTLTGDDVINAVALLREQFRTQNLRWIFHRNLEGRLRKLKDTNNNYIFSPIGVGVYNAQFLAAGMPGVLLGIPYHISEYVPDPGISGNLSSSTTLAMLGDWSQGYAIADSIDGEIVDISQRTFPARAFGLVAAYDGQVVNEQAYVRLRTS